MPMHYFRLGFSLGLQVSKRPIQPSAIGANCIFRGHGLLLAPTWLLALTENVRRDF